MNLALFLLWPPVYQLLIKKKKQNKLPAHALTLLQFQTESSFQGQQSRHCKNTHIHVDKSSIAFCLFVCADINHRRAKFQACVKNRNRSWCSGGWESWKPRIAELHHIIYLTVFTVCPWFSADNGSTSTITSGPQNLPQFEVSALFTSLTASHSMMAKNE